MKNTKDIIKALSYLTPCETNRNKIRVGRRGDGGYVMLNMFTPDGIAYSFGSGNVCDFERDMANRNYTNYIYDHTVSGKHIPISNKFKFFKLGLAAEDSENMRSIPTILKENGHLDRDDIILQCDIEGGEYDIFNIDQKYLKCFSQISLEIHWIEKYIKDDSLFNKLSSMLESLGQNFSAYHIHGNNYRRHLMIENQVVPDVIEVSLVRNDLVELSEGTTDYPTSLDVPNRPNHADIVLGKFKW